MSTQEHDLEKGSATLTYPPSVQQMNPSLTSDYPQPPPNPGMQQPMPSLNTASLQRNTSFNSSVSQPNPAFNPSAMSYNNPETVRGPPPPREATMSPSQMTAGSRHLSGMYQQPESQTLAMFRYHLGIHNDPSLIGSKKPKPQKSSRSISNLLSSVTEDPTNDITYTPGFGRPAPNVGIYQRVVAAEKKYHKEYRIFAFLINGALGLQIVFAAALTALGASNGSHTAVTAFGAFNTVIAGLLTFLKGSGLPNRLKYYENEWTKVREHIEQRERDFATDAYQGTLGWKEMTAEIDAIEHMYDNVRKDIEANTPDSYISMSNAMKSLQGPGGQNNAKTTLAKGLDRVNEKADSASHGVNQIGNDLNHRVVSGISDIQHQMSKSFGDLEKQTTVQIREVADDAHNRIRDAGKQVETQYTNASNSVNDGYRRAQNSADERLHAIDENMYTAEDAAVSKFQNAQHRLSEGQHHAESKAKEIESKIMHVGEKAAEKFLDFTKHRQH